MKTKSKPNPNSTRASTLPRSPAPHLHCGLPPYLVFTLVCASTYSLKAVHIQFLSVLPRVEKQWTNQSFTGTSCGRARKNGERKISTKRVQTCTLTQHKPFHQIHQVSNSGKSVCHGPVKASIMALQRLLQTRKAFTDLSRPFSVPHATVFLPLLYFLQRYIKY